MARVKDLDFRLWIYGLGYKTNIRVCGLDYSQAASVRQLH